MGVKERRLRDKEELKLRILTVARHIAVTEGFEALSMRRIADAVEYTPGTLYLYFRDRDDIAAHVCAMGLRQFHTHLQESIKSLDPLVRVREWAHAYVEFSVTQPETYRISLMTDHQYTEAVARASSPSIEEGIKAGYEAIGLVVVAFAELGNTGKLKAGLDPEVSAHALWSGLHGIASLRITFPHLQLPGWEVTTLALVEGLLDGILNKVGNPL